MRAKCHASKTLAPAWSTCYTAHTHELDEPQSTNDNRPNNQPIKRTETAAVSALWQWAPCRQSLRPTSRRVIPESSLREASGKLSAAGFRRFALRFQSPDPARLLRVTGHVGIGVPSSAIEEGRPTPLKPQLKHSGNSCI